MKTTNVPTLKIHKLTEAQYARELANGNIDENAIYLTPDEAVSNITYSSEDLIAGTSPLATGTIYLVYEVE